MANLKNAELYICELCDFKCSKKSNFNKSLVNKRNFNINNFSYKRDTTLQDHINYTKKYTINTSHQNRKITYQNNFINNHKHKWTNRKIL